MESLTHKSGFVAIIGNPNAGKSTLINALIGEKLSIVTYKPQTTRLSIIGIDDSEDFQIIYVDTPGIITPAYKLQEYMMKHVNRSISVADVVILVVDVRDDKVNVELKSKVNKLTVPVILAINKIDLEKDIKSKDIKSAVSMWEEELNKLTVVPISALNNLNIEKLKDSIILKLPYHPKYYPEDIITDKPVRFLVEELVREKCLAYYKEEIPYSLEVKVISFKESDRIIKIHTEIYTERQSQKNIIVGKAGESIKQIGIMAREELEKMLSKQVHLTQRVKVAPRWRTDDNKLRKFGYAES
jgi:GTP-binding protein Era